MTQKAHFAVPYSRASTELRFPTAETKNPRHTVFHAFKVLCDIVIPILSLPLIFWASVALIILNPIFNPGPLMFTQIRMGQNGERFRMYKFRTMSVSQREVRAHDAPVEDHRITPFAHYLRKFRIDELPNFINVLLGQMSVVGPRPDAWDHSTQYIATIKNYAERFQVRPGITGLAQIRGGYADSLRAVERKARYDYFYVKSSGIRMDLYIISRTIQVLFSGFGAK
jgi:lipopolysaccharide/colanic/teichoic acid biosynthesis glycosyltransferase